MTFDLRLALFITVNAFADSSSVSEIVLLDDSYTILINKSNNHKTKRSVFMEGDTSNQLNDDWSKFTQEATIL